MSILSGFGKLAAGIVCIGMAPLAGAAIASMVIGAGTITGVATATGAITAAGVTKRSAMTIGLSTATKGTQEIINKI